MDPQTVFPLKYLLNLSRRQDRRERCAELFASLGWHVLRQPAVDARRLRSAHGFESPGRYAHALSTRLILRRAELARAPAVLIMEDDIVVPPDFPARLAALELPDDWAVLYLGCQHHERPEPAGHGLVRVRAALDTHAWAVRAPYFREVRRALAGHFWKEPGTLPAADILLTELAHRLPAYAAHPNIAWQQEEVSDLLGGFAGNYDADGSVRCGLGAVPGLLAEALGGTAWPPAAAAGRACTAWFWPQAPKRHVPPPESPPPPPPLTEHGRVAFLFLTRAEHHLPQVWEHYWQAAGDRVSIHAHTKDRTALRDGGWLARAQISTHLPTEWGQISLVRAMLALLREALAAPENEFFLYASESCLPVRPPADFFHLLSTDGRSRFSWETSAAALRRNPSKNDHPPAACPIPFGQIRFHTQWMLLNREAAELIAANTALIDLFEGGFAPDEYVFGTLLHAAGYPLDQRVAARDLTWLEWPDPRSPHPRSMQELPPALAGDILASGCCFARKFLPSPETAAAALRLARMAR